MAHSDEENAVASEAASSSSSSTGALTGALVAAAGQALGGKGVRAVGAEVNNPVLHLSPNILVAPRVSATLAPSASVTMESRVDVKGDNNTTFSCTIQ